jgi:hypothetical protein
MRRGRVVLIGVSVVAVALAVTGIALAVGHRATPRSGTAAATTHRSTTTTRTPTSSTAAGAKSLPTTVPTTSTTSPPATTATTVGARADSLLYINGVNQTASDVSYTIIATCVAGTPSSIQVTVKSLTSNTPTGSIDWRLNGGPDLLFPLTQGSVTIPYVCPAVVPPSGSVQLSISYAGDSNFFSSAVIAQLGVQPG